MPCGELSTRSSKIFDTAMVWMAEPRCGAVKIEKAVVPIWICSGLRQFASGREERTGHITGPGSVVKLLLEANFLQPMASRTIAEHCEGRAMAVQHIGDQQHH